MSKFLLVLPVLGLVAGCDTMEQQQLAGTVGGAAIGAVATPNDPSKGALIGGTVGLIAGTVIGHTATGQCLYQRPDGSQYVAAC
ncbi:MAG: YMGG-like glycine zipper-containing protein [bacterium]